MYKTTITFENSDGEEITKTLYFRLTQAEVIDMEFNSPDGSVLNMLRKMSNEKNMRIIIPIVKRFMLDSYCERTDEGALIKNKEIRERFAASEEYSELFIKLISDVNVLADFVNNVIPKGQQKNIEQMKKYEKETIDEFIKTGDYTVFEKSSNAQFKVVEGAKDNAASTTNNDTSV